MNCSQNYFDLEVGKAFWGVADNFIFLQMSSDNVDYILEKSSLIDEASGEIIRSLRTKKGKYADVFYMNKNKSNAGAFRYCQTKYDRWMAPTNAQDSMAAIKALNKFENISNHLVVSTAFTKGQTDSILSEIR